MRDLGDRVAIEQFLAVWHGWRPNGVLNGRPARDETDEPENRRPGCVREQVDENASSRGIVADSEGAHSR